MAAKKGQWRARVFAARDKRLCCRRPPPLIRSAIDILMGTGTTMALVWTVNSTLILQCNCVMQWYLSLSVATAKKKTAAHTFCTAEFPNSAFSPLQMPPPAQCRPGRMPPFVPPFCRHCTHLFRHMTTFCIVFPRESYIGLRVWVSFKVRFMGYD